MQIQRRDFEQLASHATIDVSDVASLPAPLRDAITASGISDAELRAIAGEDRVIRGPEELGRLYDALVAPRTGPSAPANAATPDRALALYDAWAKAKAHAELLAKDAEARALDAALQSLIPPKGIGFDKYPGAEVRPVYTMKPGEADAAKLEKTIDQFKPGVNPRYVPRDGKTFCNVFVTDVCLATGAATPTPPYSLNANGHVDWLGSKAGKDAGWREVTAEEAQKQANAGKTVIAGWKNPNAGGSGHVAIVRPGTYDPAHGPTIANVGGNPKTSTPNNFEKGPLDQGFTPAAGVKSSEVKYWVYDGPTAKKP